MATKLGCLFAAALLALPASAQDVKELFREGVDLLQRGRKEEALAVFQKVLAADPSQEEAYELWKETDYDIWLDLMVEQGEFPLVAQRIQELSRLARNERRNDTEAIQALVDKLRASPDAIERHKIVAQLATDHGEYAVPLLARALADENDDDWRVIATHALAQMGTDVVPPLIECLASENAYQRRNVCYLLGIIRDPRASAPLAALARTDADGSVVKAAGEAATRCSSTGDPVRQFLRDGDDYHHRRATVLRSMDYSDVVWNWENGNLVSHAVPRDIYNDEMAKKSYWRALVLDPNSLEARAGLARAAIDEQAKLDTLAARGEDVADLQELAAAGTLAAYASGVDALDLALQWSVLTDDSAAGSLLCRSLSVIATTATPGLREALVSGDGAIRGEAAVALGEIAAKSQTSADPAVVKALGDAAGREIVRVAALIDGDTARASALREALSAKGILVNHRGSGAAGVAMLHAVPGLDVILVGDLLPDLTIDAVLQDIRLNPVTAEVPTFLLTANEETASTWGEHVQGTLNGAGEIDKLDEAFAKKLEGDRAQADVLAQRAARALEKLAQAGHTDVGAALESLGGTLASRPDEVTIPAMGTLAAAGNAGQVGPLVAVAAAGDRSDAARIAAAEALAQIFARTQVDATQVQGLTEVLASDASLDVRRAVSVALGTLKMTPDERKKLLDGVRVNVNKQGE
jgi:HEAT repeat protein